MIAQDLITTWQQVFTSYDRDKALTLSAEQVHLALANSGYPLSTMLVEKLVKRYGGTQQSSGSKIRCDCDVHVRCAD